MEAVNTKPNLRKMRLNTADWAILEAMSNHKRFTQQYLAENCDELEDISYEYVRQRVRHLYDNALIDRVGDSKMYIISDLGEAALEVKEQEESLDPREFGELVRDHAREAAADDS